MSSRGVCFFIHLVEFWTNWVDLLIIPICTSLLANFDSMFSPVLFPSSGSVEYIEIVHSTSRLYKLAKSLKDEAKRTSPRFSTSSALFLHKFAYSFSCFPDVS